MLIQAILLLLTTSTITIAVDVFCGELTVHEQQRFGRNSIAISSQQTNDLKECLEQCCAVVNCEGVTFGGIVESRGNEPNCMLVGCRDGCELNPRGDFIDGVISVSLSRHPATTLSTINTTEPSPSSESWASPTYSTPKPVINNSVEVRTSGQQIIYASTAPVWAVGLAILIAAFCVCFNISLISAWFCYRRRKSQKRSAQINMNKGPTLRAYNLTA